MNILVIDVMMLVSMIDLIYKGVSVYRASFIFIHEAQLMRAGSRCPNFAFMTPKFGAKKVVQYRPIWLRRPDCGPLNMKLDTCHHLYILKISIIES